MAGDEDRTQIGPSLQTHKKGTWLIGPKSAPQHLIIKKGASPYKSSQDRWRTDRQQQQRRISASPGAAQIRLDA